MKIIQLIFFTFIFSQVSLAQFNPSFEEVDSNGTLIGWKTTAGTALRATFRSVNALPFLATHRSHFVEMIDDTTAAPARHATIKNQFSLKERPRSLKLDYFYIPQVAGQSAHISIHFFNSQLDTILFATILMPPVFDSIDTNAIRVAWQTLAVDIESFYQSAETPDSAEILLATNTVPQSANPVRLLYIDNIQFGEFLTGLSNKQLFQVRVYPNPATYWVNIEAANIYRVVLYTIDGKKMIEDRSGNSEFDLQHTPPGLYLLRIEDQHGNHTTQKLRIRAGD
jgi:hypothetical protein